VALFLLALMGLACGGDGEGGLRLVFHSNRDGDDDIYIMASDGSGVRQLTDEPGRDQVPNWVEGS
jgi:Tol biopolymer transport system component